MKDIILAANLSVPLKDATGQLSKKSKRIYENDAKALAKWMQGQELTPDAFTRSDAIDYRAHLEESCQKATAKRMLSVARRIFAEQVKSGNRATNPFEGVKGFKVANETNHIALEKNQARELLGTIDQSSQIGKRDYALISLLLRTGIRRSECAALNIGDIHQEQGHTTATIRHGKGDKRRVVKVPVDVFRAIQEYIESSERQGESSDSPLFTGFDRWGSTTGKRISDKLIERAVIHYGEAIGVPDLTPHGLRASFITLALEGGATLLQVQYAAGHEDPRTTERYQKRKVNLDDNAVDYIHL